MTPPIASPIPDGLGKTRKPKIPDWLVCGKRATHRYVQPIIENGKWSRRFDDRDVVVMAVAGRYAMVRLPRAMPYVASISEMLPAKETST